MSDAIRKAKDILPVNIMIGVYANSFPAIKKNQKDANDQIRNIREELTPHKYQNFAIEWLELGVTIVGRCCGIGPEHIKKISELKKNLID